MRFAANRLTVPHQFAAALGGIAPSGLAGFEAVDFGELFDQVVELPWAEWLTEESSFPVRARCVRSQINSEPDTQAIVKKAVVEALKRTWPRDWFDETGPEMPIDVTIRRDQVTVSLDTTGRGLHRRGYRIWTGGAPLRETLSAALLQLSYWEPGRVLADPCCGTGTVLIEAAWMAANRAPGLGRGFLAEEWPRLAGPSGKGAWKNARQEADDLVVEPPEVPLLGGDRNPKALDLAKRNAEQAGVTAAIEFEQVAVADFGSHHKYGCVVTNPPYGERMGGEERGRGGLRRPGTVGSPAGDLERVRVVGSQGVRGDLRGGIGPNRTGTTAEVVQRPDPVHVFPVRRTASALDVIRDGGIPIGRSSP